MTISELIDRAKKHGPWQLNARNMIRTATEPERCPITAVTGGETNRALNNAKCKLGMTETDALDVIDAADLTANQLKLSRERAVMELRLQLKRELVGVNS